MKIQYAEMKKRVSSQKGIAVIFVLGILGLLTVIGLGFASNALLDKEISGNVANNDAARMLAKSGFERAFALLKAGAAPDKILSKGSTDHDFLWKLNTVTDGIDLFFLGNAYKPSSGTMPVWHYVRTNQSDSTSEILGRIAYVVKSDVGKLDPSVHWGDYMGNMSSGAPATPVSRFGTSETEVQFKNALLDTTLATAHITKMVEYLYKSTNGTLTTPNTTAHFENPTRWSDLLSLITVANGESGATVTTEGEADLNKNLEFINAPSPEAYWLDMNNDKKTNKEELLHRFNLARIDWDNSYFDDVNIFFGMKKNGASYEQLKNKDGKVYDYNARPYSENVKVYEKGSVPAGTPEDTNMCLDTGGIHFLGKWADNPTSIPNTWSEDLRRKQIAANIIQYCRKDTSATVTNLVDAAKSDWVANNAEPLYAGVGKHPMLNEAALKASVKATVTETPVTDNPSTYNWTYGVTFSFGAELIDMFNLKAAGLRKSEVYIYGKLAFQYYDLTAKEYKDFTVELNSSNGKIEIKPDADPSHWKGNGYTLETAFWNDLLIAVTPTGEFTDAAGKNFKENLLIKNVKLEIDRLYLKYADSAATPVMRDRDFAKIARTFATAKDTEIRVDEEKFFYGAVAAEDPRVNHYPIDWKTIYDNNDPVAGKEKENDFTITAYTVAPDFNGTSVKTTLGEKNFSLALNDPKTDIETAADPALGTISTAFIAEKPMLSLWELGAISRAEKWRTINLKRTAPYSGSVSNMSGGKDVVMAFGDTGYGAGDGNILDQVKINEVVASPANNTDKFKFERTAAYGKININSSVHNVLRAIFQNVKFNTEIAKHYRYDRSSSDNGNAFYSLTCTGRNAADTADELHPDTCIACAIKDQENPTGTNLQFKTRADLLLIDHTHILNHLKIAGTSAGINDAEQEQIAGKVVNLLKAEPLDQAHVIVVAQTIKEAKTSGTMYVDWNRDGDAEDTISISSVNNVLMNTARGNGTNILAAKNAGYLRTPMISELAEKKNLFGIRFGTESSLKEEVTKTAGTYCPGVDKITSTVKLVVTLEKDAASNKWKIVRFEYVD